MDTWETCPARPCRLCGALLPPYMVSLGRTGCSDCERYYINHLIAQSVLETGAPPDWWIDPTPFDEADAARAVYDGLRGETPPIPYGET